MVNGSESRGPGWDRTRVAVNSFCVIAIIVCGLFAFGICFVVWLLCPFNLSNHLAKEERAGCFH